MARAGAEKERDGVSSASKDREPQVPEREKSAGMEPLSVTGWSEDEHTLLCNGPLPLVKVQSGPASTATWAASLPDVRTVCAVPVPAAAALQYIDALIVIGPRKGRPPNHDLVVAVSVTRLRCRGSLRGLAGLAGRFGNDHFVPVRGRTVPQQLDHRSAGNLQPLLECFGRSCQVNRIHSEISVNCRCLLYAISMA